jgi:GTPase Era involved in 16S rRNA processing
MQTPGSTAEWYLQLLEEALLPRLHREVPYKLELELTGHRLREADGLLQLQFAIRAPSSEVAAMVLGRRGRNIPHYVDHIRRHFAKQNQLV